MFGIEQPDCAFVVEGEQGVAGVVAVDFFDDHGVAGSAVGEALCDGV